MKGLIKYVILAFALAILCLVVDKAFAGHASFSWVDNPPEDNVTRYDIHYGTQSGSYNTVVNVGTPTPDAEGRVQATLTGLPEGVTLYFAATASNAEATSDFSTEVNGTATPDAIIIAVPQDFRKVN